MPIVTINLRGNCWISDLHKVVPIDFKTIRLIYIIGIFLHIYFFTYREKYLQYTMLYGLRDSYNKKRENEKFFAVGREADVTTCI